MLLYYIYAVQYFEKENTHMTVSKAQQKAVNKYVKNHYDRINVNFPEGDKENIKNYAAQAGESVNSYIRNAVIMRMQSEPKPKKTKNKAAKK